MRHLLGLQDIQFSNFPRLQPLALSIPFPDSARIESTSCRIHSQNSICRIFCASERRPEFVYPSDAQIQIELQIVRNVRSDLPVDLLVELVKNYIWISEDFLIRKRTECLPEGTSKCREIARNKSYFVVANKNGWSLHENWIKQYSKLAEMYFIYGYKNYKWELSKDL